MSVVLPVAGDPNGSISEMIVKLFIKEIIKSIAAVISKILNKNVISKYFDSDVLEVKNIDLFFYQLGLRKNLPIMDLLYFEFIKYLNKTYKIKKLIIFPTIDMTETSQQDNDLNIFRENIDKVFKNSNIEIDIIDPYKDRYFDKKDLVSNDFIETLKYIGSDEYFEILRDDYKIKINSISDFNKFHKDGEKIKNIYTHINKSWSIIKYIRKNVDLTTQVNISAIFWEWEVDKLGVMKHCLNNNIIFSPVFGLTQMLNKKKPIPVFSEDKTICVFENIISIIKKANKLAPYLKKYNLLLESILLQYDNTVKRKEIRIFGEKFWRNNLSGQITTSETKNLLKTKKFYLFLGLIKKIKLLIENENT
jgi:hypothetical protein